MVWFPSDSAVSGGMKPCCCALSQVPFTAADAAQMILGPDTAPL